MRRPSLALAFALALPACFAGSTSTVMISIAGTPSLVMYRDGAGPWRDLGAGVAGDYDLHVADAYTLVVACSDATGFDTVVRARTIDDGDHDYIYCAGHGLAAPNAVQVTGRMLQAGTVSAGDVASSTTAPWDFALEIAPGVRDVMAVGNGKVAIGRGLSIDGPTQLTLIDLDANGTPLAPVPLALANLSGSNGEAITTEIDLYGANDVAFGPSVPGTIAQTIPTQLLVDTDNVDLFVDVVNPAASTERTADTWFTGVETSLQLMPEISGVTYTTAGGSLQASWSTLPPYTSLAVAAEQGANRQEYSASQTYLDRAAATQLELAFELPPRFQPAWLVDLSQPYVRAFTATDGSTGIVYTTTIREPVGNVAARQVSGARRRILP
jgi:hypothetical protein